jgi:pimeloyl-ACP methyl ester carboxylesterase
MLDRRDFLAMSAAWGAGVLAGCTATTRRPSRFHSDRISVLTFGRGPDVLLIPGLATSGEVWRGTRTALPGFRYHVVQIAGFAGTPTAGNAGPGPLIDRLAAEIGRYVVEQRLERPAIIGHSLGGLLALMTASALPDIVSRTMVVDMVPFGAMLFAGADVTDEQARTIAPQARLRYFGADAVQRTAATERLYSTMIRDPALRPAYLAQAMSCDLDVCGRLFEEVARTDLRPRLKAIQTPVTVLYVSAPNIPIGDERTDALYRAAYRDLPQARLKRIEGSYHFIMLDQPERFVAEVRAFLSV